MKKSEFIKQLRINELVGPNKGLISGGFPLGDDSEIQTGPVPKQSTDNSTYEKGVSPTTDKVRRNTSQGKGWQLVYTGAGGYTEKSIKREGKIAEDMLNKKTDSTIKADIISKINAMSEPELETLKKYLTDAKQ